VYASRQLWALFMCSKCGRFRLARQGNALPCLALLDQRRERPRSDKERSCLLLLLFAVARDEGRVPAGQVTTPGVAGRPN